jgi:cytohesin
MAKVVWWADLTVDEIADALRRGADPNAVDAENGQTALFDAVKNRRLLALLLEAGANPNVANHKGETPLTYCADWGRLDEAECLLDHGADPNFRAGDDEPWPALHYAAHWGHLEVVKLLLSAGADPDCMIDGRSAFYFACEHGHLRVAEALALVSSPAAIACARSGAERLVDRAQKLAEVVKNALGA